MAARRAGQPRRLKALDPSALRTVAAAMQLRAPAGGGDPALLPSAAAVRLAAREKSPATWNRYASVLRRWETYAVRAGTPFLPADPTHFANFLAEAAAGARGNTQSEQRACAIAALSTLAGVPSPADDPPVSGVPSGGRGAGRARSSATSFLPRAPSPGPTGAGVGPAAAGPGWPPPVRKRALAQAMRCAAILEPGSRPTGRRRHGGSDRGRRGASRKFPG